MDNIKQTYVQFNVRHICLLLHIFYINTITYCSGRAIILFNYLVSESVRLYFKQTALGYCSSPSVVYQNDAKITNLDYNMLVVYRTRLFLCLFVLCHSETLTTSHYRKKKKILSKTESHDLQTVVRKECPSQFYYYYVIPLINIIKTG